LRRVRSIRPATKGPRTAAHPGSHPAARFRLSPPPPGAWATQ
jgi:hypothetical protein